jgi:hypothetical protein
MFRMGIFFVVTVFTTLIARGFLPRTSPPPPVALENDVWVTYTCPKTGIQFEHPSQIKIGKKVDEVEDVKELVSAVSGSTTCDSVVVGFLVVQGDEWVPGSAQWLINRLITKQSRPLSPTKKIWLEGMQGSSQEILDMSTHPHVEANVILLESKPYYLLFVVGYRENTRSKMRPICEKIAASLTVKR